MEASGNVANGGTAEVAEAQTVSKEVVEAIHLLAQGKRNMMCMEIPPAVQQFQEACEILGKTYGEVADECGDAYYWYGKSLLELSRMEGGVMGDAMPQESEDSQSENENSEEQDNTNDDDGSATEDDDADDGSILSEDIEDEEADTGGKADSTNDTIGETVTGTSSEAKDDLIEKHEVVVLADINKQEKSGTEEDKQQEKDGREEDKQQENTEASSASAPSTSKTSADTNQLEEDDVSNLQLAWEMLELAKFIYGRRNTRDMKLKLADTYLKLGEIGMETEQFDQSINDLTHSLNLLKSYLSPEDRHIAETLYQLGLACQLDKRYDNAVQNFEDSIRVLESRVVLQKGIVSGEIQPELASESSDGFYTPQELAAKEIEEINTIIPDIRSKIEDVIDEKRSESRVRSMMDSLSQPSSSAADGTLSSSIATSSSSVAATSSVAAEKLGGAISCQSSESSTGFSESMNVPVNNITHLIRKKRKDDSENECPDVKRACTQTTNSVHQNGEMSATLSAAEENGSSRQLSTRARTKGEANNGEVEK